MILHEWILCMIFPLALGRFRAVIPTRVSNFAAALNRFPSMVCNLFFFKSLFLSAEEMEKIKTSFGTVNRM